MARAPFVYALLHLPIFASTLAIDNFCLHMLQLTAFYELLQLTTFKSTRELITFFAQLQLTFLYELNNRLCTNTIL